MDENNEKTGTLYVLKHPETGEVRYVGITTSTTINRLAQHIFVARRGHRKTYCADWIKSLLDQGLRPVIEVITENVPIDELNDLEVEYIQKCTNEGVRLTNLTSGGKANFSVSEETRKKQSLAKLGKPLTPEHRANIAKAQIGQTHSEETKKRMSEIAVGRTRDEETRSKISETRKSSGVASGTNNPNASLTESDVLEIYELLLSGATNREITERFGVGNVSGIRYGRTWKNLYTQLSEEDRAKLSEKAPMSPRTKEHAENISKARREKGSAKGSKHPRTSLTESDVLEIYKDLKSGKSYSDVGKKFNLGKSTVAHIAKGTSWSHLYHHYTQL